MPVQKPTSELIVKSILGELDDTSSQILDDWLQSDPTNASKYNDWKRRLQNGDLISAWESIDLEVNWNEVVAKSRMSGKQHTRHFTFLRYAAAAALLILAGIWWLLKDSQTIITNEGPITIVSRLPDQSNIWLKPGASIQFDPSQFSTNREVSLKGEGYFEVQKSEVPFKVDMDGSIIEVLGTTFRASRSKNVAKVTLIEGAVRFATTSEGVVLSPGEEVHYDGKSFQVNSEINTNELGWKTGIFRFVQTPIQEVIRQLSPYYGIESVEIAARKEQLTLTMSLDQLSLEDLVMELSYVLDSEVKVENGKLIIR